MSAIRGAFCNRQRTNDRSSPKQSKPHGRESAIDVIGGAGDEAAGGARDEKQGSANEFVRLTETGHRCLSHDLGRSLRGENLAILLRRKEAGAKRVHTDVMR